MSDTYETYFNKNVVSQEFFSLIVGNRLGFGIGREVFEYLPDKSKVIKFECNQNSFQNVLEWETWNALKGTSAARWLAPCTEISFSGSILIQERTQPIHKNFKFPDRLPLFLSDFKRDNYGVLGGKLVCHDYGTNVAISTGAYGTKKITKYVKERLSE